MWHGAAHGDEARGTSSTGISKVVTPVVSAAWRALFQAVTHRSSCCGCQGLCCCQPGMLVPSMQGTPWHAALGSSYSLQDWEEGKRGAA